MPARSHTIEKLYGNDSGASARGSLCTMALERPERGAPRFRRISLSDLPRGLRFSLVGLLPPADARANSSGTGFEDPKGVCR